MTVALHSSAPVETKGGLFAARNIPDTPAGQDEHLVLFTLGEECYAVDIGDIWEINTMQKITWVPRVPDFIEGVVNLRGEIVPIMDLRKRLGLTPRAQDRNTRIMITETAHNRVGLIVDSVREVLKIPRAVIKPAAELGLLIDEEFVRGVAQKDEQLIVLIDLKRLLDEDEAERLGEMEMD